MLTKSARALFLILAGICILAGSNLHTFGVSDEPSDAQAKKRPDSGEILPRATVKVEKGRLTSSVTLKGTVEGENRTDVRVRLKTWAGPLIVEQAIEHGTPVKAGDLLLKFDAEKIQQLVRETREERESAALAIQLAEQELPFLKQQLPLDLQAAEREKKQTGEDLQRFLQVDKTHEIEGAEFMLRSAEFNVESSRDELEQLEKMYRDKDLTEETEQMILKRYKFSLASAEHRLQATKIQTEKTLKFTLPRREEAATLAAVKAELTWEKVREELPLKLKQKELALEKQRHDIRRADKLAALEHDLNQMTITAPADGLAYYGRYALGQWSGLQAAAYLKGGTLPANEVVLTIVSRGKLFLHAEAEEREIGEIKVSQAARISPTVSPHRKLSGRVQRVVPVPRGGKYEVLVAVTDDLPESIVPGMTGTVKIITNQNDAALSVPSSAVFEGADGEAWHVYRPGEKPRKQAVKIGMIAGDKTEILEGLAEGDEILAAKP